MTRPQTKLATSAPVLLLALCATWSTGSAQPQRSEPPDPPRQIPDGAIQLPDGFEALRIQRGPDGSVFILGRNRVLRLEPDGSTVTLEFDEPVESVAVLPPGVPVMIRSDTLGLLAGSFMPVMRLPHHGMRLSRPQRTTIFLFAGQRTAGNTGTEAVYSLESLEKLSHVADLKEPGVDVVTIGDTTFIASRRVIYAVIEDSLHLYFATEKPSGITGMDRGANGSLFLSTENGTIEVAADASGGRWLTDIPTDDVAVTNHALYMLNKSDRYVWKLPIRR